MCIHVGLPCACCLLFPRLPPSSPVCYDFIRIHVGLCGTTSLPNNEREVGSMLALRHLHQHRSMQCLIEFNRSVLVYV